MLAGRKSRPRHVRSRAQCGTNETLQILLPLIKPCARRIAHALPGRNTITLATASGSTSLVSQGNTDAFVAKLAGASGVVQWAQSWGGNLADQSKGLAVGTDGKLYVGGSYRSASMIVGTANLTSPSSTNSGFVVSLDANTGAPLWAVKASSTTVGNNGYVNGVALSSAGE